MAMPAEEQPKRLIVLGAENEPDERKGPRIVAPGSGQDAPASGVEREDEPPAVGSRIILPPGVATSTTEDVPEYPKLRPLILMPISDGQREMLLVQDPLGVIPGQPVLGIESLALLQLFDGSASLTDLTAILMRENKDLRMASMVRDFVAKLDQLLMLD